MSTREPFFEPLPEPEDEVEAQRTLGNFPWRPPFNVAPVLVPLARVVFESPEVLLRLESAAVHDRGVEFRLHGWLHPDAAERADEGPYGMRNEPRFGVLLDDGTRLGAADEHHPAPTVGPGAASLQRSGGQGSDLIVGQDWWLWPVPSGPFEVVVAWPQLDVPETFVRIDDAALREASTRARVLWPLADIPDDVGWFAYAPGGETAYRPDDGTTPEGDPAPGDSPDA